MTTLHLHVCYSRIELDGFRNNTLVPKMLGILHVIFKMCVLERNVLRFIGRRVQIDNMSALVSVMPWRPTGKNPLPDPMTILSIDTYALQWRHNGRDGVLNHQPHDRLLNRLFGRRSKKTSKLRVTGLGAGNSPGTGEFPAQRASNAENVSIWWHHHGLRHWALINECFQLTHLGRMRHTYFTKLGHHWLR